MSPPKAGSQKDIRSCFKVKTPSTYLREKRVRIVLPGTVNDGFKVPRTRSKSALEGETVGVEQDQIDGLSNKRKLPTNTASVSKRRNSQKSPAKLAKTVKSTIISEPDDPPSSDADTPSVSKGQTSSKRRKSTPIPSISTDDTPSVSKRQKSLAKLGSPRKSTMICDNVSPVRAANISTRGSCDTSPKKITFPIDRVVTYGRLKTVNLAANTRKNTSNVRESYPKVKTRMSPNLFVNFLQCLETYEQWKAINEIGFGGIYWLRVSQMPMQLGYWLLSNYEPAKNALILPGGQELYLKPIDVHATLGLPLGTKKVQLASSINDSEEFTEFYKSWRNQFGRNSGVISTKTLAGYLGHQVEGDDMFKINFVVLVVSLLIQSTQKPNANFHVLKSLMLVDDIPNYNWCEYVLESLRDSQLAWVQSNKKSYFTGPLLFLLLVYVDRVVHRSRSVERDYFTLAGWTTHELNLREKSEKKYGKFGVGAIEDAMSEVVDISSMQRDVKDYVVDLAITTKTVSDQLFLLQSKLDSACPVLPANEETVNRLRDVAFNLLNGSFETVVDDTKADQPRLSPDDSFFNLPEVAAALEAADHLAKKKQSSKNSPEVYSSPEAYIHDFSINAKKMARSMVCLDEKVEIGAINFPDNETVKNLHSTTSLLYRSYGGCDEPAPSTLWKVDDLDDAHVVAACDAAEKAYQRKCNYELTRSQFRRFQHQSQPAEIGEFTFDLGLSDDFGVGSLNGGLVSLEDTMFDHYVSSIVDGCLVGDVGKEVSKEVHVDGDVTEDVVGDNVVAKEVRGDASADIHDNDRMETVADIHYPSSDDDKGVDSEATDSDPITVDDTLTPPSSPTSPTHVVGGVVTRRRTSTAPPAPELCSPYLIRVVDVGTTITKKQRMLCDYVFDQDPATKPEDNEVLFDYKSHHIIRYSFRSLIPHQHVSSGIIDGWAAFLNHGEISKSKSSPLRFYSSTLIFRMITSSKVTTDDQRNKCFKNALDEELKECYWIAVKDIDMFFFPITLRNHFFLFVFDLKNIGFYIMDNLQSRASIENLYDMFPTFMQNALGQYLLSNDDTHAKGNIVSALKPVIVKMPWRNTSNVDDCGIFTMRHMETFKGDIKWKCGLKKNDVGTLEKLRLKYCATLILFKGNKVLNDIISRAKEFQKKKMEVAEDGDDYNQSEEEQ